MTKFLKNRKGQFFIDKKPSTKAHFLRRMIEEGRKQYIKESKKGNYYYSKILKGEMSFYLTTKIIVTKKGEKFLMWEYEVSRKTDEKRKRLKKPKITNFYAIETQWEKDQSIIIFQDRKFVEKGKNQFNDLIKEMLETVKEKYKLENVYCRAIVDILFTLGSNETFELKFSSKGYVFELKLKPSYKFKDHVFTEPLERLYFDLINKIFTSQSILKYEFTKINLLCT